MLDIRLDQFEGPLDLLLHLIEEEKLDITEVSLARVADEYLARLTEFSQSSRLDELSDFVVIAAKLLLIKSRLLIPVLSSEEEEDIEELARQLKMYKVFYEAAKKIDALSRKKTVAFPRRAPLPQDTGFSPPASLTPLVLKDVFMRVLSSAQALIPKPREIIFIPRVSIREKIEEIVTLLTNRTRCHFAEIIQGARSRGDVVVSFMALLELVKQRSVFVTQSELFHDIVISRNPSPALSDQRGQTLLEVLGGFFVIAIGLVGIMSLATTNVRNDGIGLSRLIATNLARESIEVVRNIRDSNWLSDKPWYIGLVDGVGNQCAIIPSVRTGALQFIACPAGPSFFDSALQLSTSSQTMPVDESKPSENVLSFDEYVQDGGHSSATEKATVFYRKIMLDPLCLNGTSDAETTDNCVFDADCLDESKRVAKPSCAIGMRVTADVAWKQSGTDHQTRIRENIYDWR
ncbi:MAG: segregation/condensation protein A [Candidatus Uhrbacteria bacterium]|nr:segregation/condensation protein A [Candidatus Uhrbacteria bacterium]